MNFAFDNMEEFGRLSLSRGSNGGSLNPAGAWNRRGMESIRDRRGSEDEPAPRHLGSGLPSSPVLIRSPQLSRGGLKRIPRELPQLQESIPSKKTSNKMKSSISLPG